MKRDFTEAELLHKAAAYCSASERCTSEVKEKLQKWGATNDAAVRIINRLYQEKFIDDSRYAMAFTKDKFRFAKWGKVKIKVALQQKKIKSETIDEAIIQIEDESYNENLITLLSKKKQLLKDSDTQTIKGKLFRFALSKGYEPNAIFRCLSEILNDNDSTDME